MTDGTKYSSRYIDQKIHWAYILYHCGDQNEAIEIVKNLVPHLFTTTQSTAKE